MCTTYNEPDPEVFNDGVEINFGIYGLNNGMPQNVIDLNNDLNKGRRVRVSVVQHFQHQLKLNNH